MTPDQLRDDVIAALANVRSNRDYGLYIEHLDAAIRTVVEACAKVCDDMEGTEANATTLAHDIRALLPPKDTP